MPDIQFVHADVVPDALTVKGALWVVSPWRVPRVGLRFATAVHHTPQRITSAATVVECFTTAPLAPRNVHTTIRRQM